MYFKHFHNLYSGSRKLGTAYLAMVLASFFFLCLQAPYAQAMQQELSEEAQISLITIYPGTAPEELFGHSAVRVFDPAQNLDLLFNYGTFQFDDWFLFKFIYGELNYFLSVVPYQRAVEVYRNRRRPMVEQVLNLTPAQRGDLYHFLRINAQPENRYYRYDFLFDNCSTRIRDALQAVIENDLKYAPQPDPGLSFRELIDLYLGRTPFLKYGIDLLLGSPVDAGAGPWEVMFLPDFLMEAFEEAEIHTGNEWQPLVASTDIVLQIEGYEFDTESRTAHPWVTILFWGLFAIAAWLSWKQVFQSENRLPVRWFDVPLFGFAGLVGMLITFLWFISLHEVTAANWNLAWAWPTHLVVAVLLLRRKLVQKWIITYLLISAGVAATFLLGWIFWPQYIHPAVAPFLLIIILRCAVLSGIGIQDQDSAYSSA